LGSGCRINLILKLSGLENDLFFRALKFFVGNNSSWNKN
jgi:hypothetical protein